MTCYTLQLTDEAGNQTVYPGCYHVEDDARDARDEVWLELGRKYSVRVVREEIEDGDEVDA